MKARLLIVLLAATTLAGLGSTLVHPYGVTPQTGNAPGELLTGAQTDPEVRALLERSCQNCHSQKTQWPWYSHVAPLSWIIEKDVSAARSHMNLSNWQAYSDEQRIQILSEVGSLIRNRVMPPARYLALHPDAKLSDKEVDQLYQWTRHERRRLRSLKEPIM